MMILKTNIQKAIRSANENIDSTDVALAAAVVRLIRKCKEICVLIILMLLFILLPPVLVMVVT